MQVVDTELPCGCPDCTCPNPGDIDLGNGPMCGCCLADCPDVHGPDGKTWRKDRLADAAATMSARKDGTI